MLYDANAIFGDTPNFGEMVETAPEVVGAKEVVDAESIIPKNSRLTELLDAIEKVNFMQYFEDMGISEPKQKHYLVAIIEKLLEHAKAHRWDLIKQGDFIYFYNGTHWANIPADSVKAFLSLSAIKMGFMEIEAKGYEFRDKLYKQFLALAHFEEPTHGDKVLINLLNGTFEVNNGKAKLREHRREDFLTYVLPFAYKEEATSPRFQSYLDEVLPDTESQTILKEFCGYIFTKHLKLEKMLVLHGSGANGKSVFLDVLGALLGRENISNYSLASLKEEHNRAMLKDKLTNWGYEIHGSLESDTFKALASGEPIQARLKYGNSFMMTDYAKLAFNANTLPKEIEHNEAYFRRFLIISFDVTIPEHKRNANLAKEIVSEELEGVFKWIVGGLGRILKQKRFSDCRRSKDALEAYKKESDTVALFVEENEWEKSTERKTYTKFLYEKYGEFCKEGGFRALNIRHFSGRLKHLGFEHIKSNGFNGFYICQT